MMMPFPVTKVDPWDTVTVTFRIPRDAANRLRQLARCGDHTLRELGVRSVQLDDDDQVVTLTLANRLNENRQQLTVGKIGDSSALNTTISVNTSSASTTPSAVNSSPITITNSVVNHTNTILNNSVTSSSVVSSLAESSNNDYNYSPSSSSVSSVEITRKNIAQYLSEQQVNVVNNVVVRGPNHSPGPNNNHNNTTIVTNNNNPNPSPSTSRDLPAFCSPNVVAPVNTEPIPFLSTNTTVTTSVLSTATTLSVVSNNGIASGAAAAAAAAAARLPTITNASPTTRDVQSNYGLFPFASMQYQAMHTKQGFNHHHHHQQHHHPGHPSSNTPKVQKFNHVITSAPSVCLPLNISQTTITTTTATPTIMSTTTTTTIPTTDQLLLLPQNSSATTILTTTTPSLTTNTNVSSTTVISLPTKPQTTTSRDDNNLNVNVCRSILSLTTATAPTYVSHPTQPPSVSTVHSSSASVNVALTSPLLVNLLQSDATSGHIKGAPHTTVTSAPNNNNNNTVVNRHKRNHTTELAHKRKPRISRKSRQETQEKKEKKDIPETCNESSAYVINTNDITQTMIPTSVLQTTVSTIASASSSPKCLPPSNPLLQSQSLTQSSSPSPTMGSQQVQTKTFKIYKISIPINSMSRYPSIHPEAQGQPQVVRGGHLPLRPQLTATNVGSPPIATTQLLKPLFVTISNSTANIKANLQNDDKSQSSPNCIASPNHELLNKSLASETNNKISESDVVVISSNKSNNDVNDMTPPPTSATTTTTTTTSMSGKAKHLINPFTGLLEPMSDEEEDDRPSPTAIFPEMDTGSEAGGNSERSLSDTGSNGKDNQHSSDTDSGLGKSGTDVSSQSSIDVPNGDAILTKACITENHIKNHTNHTNHTNWPIIQNNYSIIQMNSPT
ncbi:mucin-2-like [Oppia nitens]|uniref:mucin-2-like n=1 Tax=Oppia nitens TaxID=1686743 RepID=UPI0023DB9CF0|nr:mucin-2-like [Oppia nitens]